MAHTFFRWWPIRHASPLSQDRWYHFVTARFKSNPQLPVSYINEKAARMFFYSADISY